MPVASLKFKDFQQVIDRMKKERLSFSSLKKVRSMISLVLSFGIQYEIVTVNYAPLLKLGKNKPVKPHHPFTRQAINRIWQHADLPGADAILILLYTGMRCGEMLALAKKDVNLRTKVLRITKSKTASGLRTIPIHNKILPFVLARMRHPGKTLIADDDGRPYSYARFCSLWDKVMTACNIRHHTTHDCRHTVATLLDNAGANEAAKKRILGHAGSGVTEAVYTHKNLLQLRKTIQLLK
jgi:integrase